PTASCGPPTSARRARTPSGRPCSSTLRPTSRSCPTARAAFPRAHGECVRDGWVGFRWGDEGAGRWNLELGAVDPALTLHGRHDELVEVDLPRFDVGGAGGVALRRGVPAKRVGGRLVTTVFDLMAAQLGVHREGLPGNWAAGCDDADQPDNAARA